jgi:hypothetical protein
VDLRGTTPLLAAYKSGHFEVVEWLLAHVAHLPSDPECTKALQAPMPSDTDLAPQRDKCYELIMKVSLADVGWGCGCWGGGEVSGLYFCAGCVLVFAGCGC